MTTPTWPFLALLRHFAVAAVLTNTTIAAASTSAQMVSQSDGATLLRPDSSARQESAEATAANLVMQAFALIGTKYKLGGNSAETGFDCSGFIRHLYETASDLTLPRTSSEMSRLGRKITPEELLPGDLVFYNTLKRAFSHVGIYIGEQRFIHSPSKGRAVEIVEMRDRYWQRRFNGARRILEDLSAAPAAPSPLMGPELPPELAALSASK
jgi:cell wall-associated NlpC family hydrolase